MDVRESPPDTSQRGYGYVKENALFSLAPKEVSIESVTCVDFGTSSVVNNISPFIFQVHATPNRVYMDMHNIELHIRCKITLANGSNISSSDRVAMINYIIAGMISGGEVNINGVLVESVNLYPYKAMIETLLKSSSNEMGSYLTQGLFKKEVAGQLDVTTPIAPADASSVLPGTRQNVVLSQRYEYTKESKEVEVISKLHFSLFQKPEQRYLINSCQLEIKLRQATDAFRLLCENDDASYKLEVTGAFIRVPMVTISPSVFLAHSAALKVRNCLYEHEKVEIKSWLLKAGTSGDELSNPFSGRCPSRVIVCLVPQNNFNGSYSTNPFLFLPFNMSNFTLEMDSKSVPNRPIRTNFTNGMYMQAYNTLFSMKNEKTGEYPSISRAEYIGGYFFLIFDLQSHVDQSDFVQSRQSGRSRITISFDRDLEQNTQCLIYSTYPAVTSIDESRNVYPSLV